MPSNRLPFLVILGLATIMLAACNAQPGGQTAQTPSAKATEVTPEEVTSVDVITPTDYEAEQANPAAEELPSHLTEEGFVATTPSGQSLQPQLAQANIDMNDVVRLLPPDAIRAVNPEELPEIMVTATEANEAGLNPDTRIMGVSINGESHAYPIPFLSRHEIINTDLGGRLIAATW